MQANGLLVLQPRRICAARRRSSTPTTAF